MAFREWPAGPADDGCGSTACGIVDVTARACRLDTGRSGRNAARPIVAACAAGSTRQQQHLCIVMGHCVVVDGHDRKELTGWNVFVSEPGSKRAIVALEDTVWMTVHATDQTDVAAVEREVLQPEPAPSRFFPEGDRFLREGMP